MTISIKSQQLINLPSYPSGTDVVRAIPGTTGGYDRLGHLRSGTWNDGWATWCSLGTVINSFLQNAPTDSTLYGLTVNDQGDRMFVGSRLIAKNRCDGVIAWGDDNWTNQGGSNPDRLVFEFHDSNAGVGGTTIKKAMTMMPDPSNTGVFTGIGIYTPTEQLHTTQGVRFQGLVSGAVNNLVGIDATGKLWRTPMIAPSSLGNLCSAPSQNPIAGNYEIPLNNNIFYFSGQGLINPSSNQNMVAIGYNCLSSSLPAGKLNVLEQQSSSTVSNEVYAGYFKNLNVGSSSNKIGGAVFGTYKTLNQNSSALNIGGIFEGYGTLNTVGVMGRTSKSTANGSSYGNLAFKSVGVFGIADTLVTSFGGSSALTNIGTFGYADKATNGNFGVYGEVGPTATGLAVGVYGKAPSSNTGSLSKWAGYFSGDVSINGQLLVSSTWYTSDKRFKSDIKKIESVNDKLKNIHGYTYKFKTQEFKDRNFSDKEQIGFVAQELKEAFPQLVSEGKDGYMAVNYQGMIPVLLEAFKEQQSQIEKQNEAILNQQKQIDELKAVLKSLVNNTTTINDKSLAVSLSDKNVIVLNQNVPNPFAESTVITFNVPTNYTKAQIIFNTVDGKIIKTVDITTKGEGSLNVFANDLSSGIYNYTLVIDGKNIETKKMVKQ